MCVKPKHLIEIKQIKLFKIPRKSTHKDQAREKMSTRSAKYSRAIEQLYAGTPVSAWWSDLKTKIVALNWFAQAAVGIEVRLPMELDYRLPTANRTGVLP